MTILFILLITYNNKLPLFLKIRFYFRSIHSRFGVGKATAIRAVRRVTQTLCYLSSRFIQWPTGVRIEEIMMGFSHVGAFPRTIGAIDGTHVNIPAPKKNPEAYVNRKGHHSIQAQVHSLILDIIYKKKDNKN